MKIKGFILFFFSTIITLVPWGFASYGWSEITAPESVRPNYQDIGPQAVRSPAGIPPLRLRILTAVFTGIEFHG
jgi:hypothetical protein